MCYVSMYGFMNGIMSYIEENPSNSIEKYILNILLIITIIEVNVILCAIMSQILDINKIDYVNLHIRSTTKFYNISD